MSISPLFDEYLTPPEAGLIVRRSVRTLARMRAEGRGPKYHQEGGRVLYPVSGSRNGLPSTRWFHPGATIDAARKRTAAPARSA
jgi:hypothetical protein